MDILGCTNFQSFITILYLLGIIFILGFVWTFVKEILIIIRSYFVDVKKNYWTPDSYALVTGASDGIGLSFCEELSKLGFNICLVGRNLEKLKAAESKIVSLSGVKTKIVVADFVNSNKENFFEKLVSDIGNIEISILVNNAGMGERDKNPESPESTYFDVMNVNMFPPLILTSKLLPKMQKRAKKSLVINVSSITSNFFLPNGPVYSATKSFINVITEAFNYRLNDKIEFYCLKPAFVSTKLTHYIKSPFSITPTQCSKACLSRVGLENGSFGHWIHRLQGFFMQYFANSFRKIGEKMIQKQRQNSKKEK